MNIRKAYLTIDDSPGKDFRSKIDFLIKKGIPAILFCVGEKMQNCESDIIHAIQNGFVIANHSYTHSYFSDLSLEECKAEIKKTDEIIDRLYRKSGVDRPARFFRFPYFDTGGDLSSKEYEENQSRQISGNYKYQRDDKRKAIQLYLKELGYRQPVFENINLNRSKGEKIPDEFDVRCTYNQMEYFLGVENAPMGLNKPEAILARVDEYFPEEDETLNGMQTTEIILIHDHDRTTELFYKIVNRYIEKGICFLKTI